MKRVTISARQLGWDEKIARGDVFIRSEKLTLTLPIIDYFNGKTVTNFRRTMKNSNIEVYRLDKII